MTRHQRNVEQKIASHIPQIKALTRFVNNAYEALKAYYYWQSSTQLKDGRDGTVYVSVIIVPITRRYANPTVKTPTERVRYQSMELLMHMRLSFAVRRPPNTPSPPSSRPSRTRETLSASLRTAACAPSTTSFYVAALAKCYAWIAKGCRALKEVKPKGNNLYVQVNDERMSHEAQASLQIHVQPYNSETVIE
ncbi:hypothetical protein AAVH_29174 [Aphelenchoides avenae]|nr:hypothetical protein AAVH_29174 [Aphelenchus avenae]